jgi:RNA polymerase sigma-70 factor (ECF subfamily)
MGTMRSAGRGEEERMSFGEGYLDPDTKTDTDPGAVVRAQEAALTRAVEGAHQGDEDGFATLYRHVQPSLLRYLRTLVGDEAEDVASEAWLQVSRDVTAFRGDGAAFRGWVRAVARNRAVDHLRRLRGRPAGVSWDVCGTEAAPPVRDAAEVVMDGFATARVIRLIGQLPPDQAEAVLLRVLVGLDSPAAGRVLGKQAGAVRMATRRGLRALAGQVGSAGESAATAA